MSVRAVMAGAEGSGAVSAAANAMPWCALRANGDATCPGRLARLLAGLALGRLDAKHRRKEPRAWLSGGQPLGRQVLGIVGVVGSEHLHASGGCRDSCDVDVNGRLRQIVCRPRTSKDQRTIQGERREQESLVVSLSAATTTEHVTARSLGVVLFRPWHCRRVEGGDSRAVGSFNRLESRTRRRRELPGRALLIGLAWHAVLTGADMHLTGVAALLGRASAEQARELGVRRQTSDQPVSYRQVEDTFGKLIRAAVAGLVVPHDHELADRRTGEVLPCPGPAGGCRHQVLTLDDIAARLLAASLPPSVPSTGAFAVDSTDYETWACRQSWTATPDADPDALPVAPPRSDT